MPTRARVRRVHEAAGTEVDPHMPGPVEEDEIARREPGPGDGTAEPELRLRRVRQLQAELRVDVAHEPRAVEALPRRRPAAAVGRAEQPAGERGRPQAAGRDALGRSLTRVPDGRRARARRPAREREQAAEEDERGTHDRALGGRAWRRLTAARGRAPG